VVGKKLTMGFKARLGRALARSGMSVRGLGKELEAQYSGRVRGATYGALRQYLDESSRGVKNPRIELLQAIASILDVRWEWLAYDEGAATNHEQALAEAATAPPPQNPDDEDLTKLRAALAGMWDDAQERESLYWAAAVAVEQSWIQAWVSQPYSDVGAAAASASSFVRVVLAPLRELSVNLADLPDDAQMQYAFGMCQVVLGIRDRVLPPQLEPADYFKQRPLPEVPVPEALGGGAVPPKEVENAEG
jgi:transcriptional regulator with XRE-family HTH domain